MTHARLAVAAALIAASATLQAAPSALPGQNAQTADRAAGDVAAAEPGRHFGLTVEAFAGKEYARAAEEIRKGGAYVEQQARRAAGGAKRAMNAAAEELTALARNVEKGAVKDAALLESAFAKAKKALSAARRDAPIPGDPAYDSRASDPA